MNKKLIKVIEVSLLNDMLSDFKSMKYAGETFEDFIDCTTDDDVYVWRLTEEKHLRKVNKENEDENQIK